MYLAQSLFFFFFALYPNREQSGEENFVNVLGSISFFLSFLPYIPIGSLFADFRMDHSNVVKFKKEVAISYLSVVERPESFI